MNKMLTAIALSIAIPAVANAQATPAPAPKKMECCEKMKEKCDCCKGMDHSKMDHGKQGAKAGADAHAGHDKEAAGTTADKDHKN